MKIYKLKPKCEKCEYKIELQKVKQPQVNRY